MSRILIPRGPCGSSKTVASTDWEKYFCDVVNDYIVCGVVITGVACMRNLSITAGQMRIDGLHLNNSSTDTSVTCLTACDTHFIYATVNKDCMCRPCNWTFTSNTTGITATSSMLIGTVVTSACDVTSVNTCAGNSVSGIERGVANSVLAHSITIGDYSQPTTAVATSEGLYEDDGSAGCSPCHQCLFCCDNFTDVGSGFGVICCALAFCATPGSDDSSWKDLNPVLCCANLGNTWVLRYKLRLTTNSTNNSLKMFIGMSSTTGTAGDSQANRDSIGLVIRNPTTGCNNWNARDTNGSAWTSGCPDCSDTTTAPTCTDFYVETIRTSDTGYTVRAFTCVSFCTPHTALMTGTISACATTGLRYILIQNQNAGSGGQFTGTIDCLEVWNNTTDATSAKKALAAVDCSVAVGSWWGSNAEANPAIYVDAGACPDDGAAIAFYPKTGCCACPVVNTNDWDIIKIRASTDATFTDSETVRTITRENVTEETWNFFRFNRPLVNNTRFYQIRVEDTESRRISMKEIKILTNTDVEWTTKHGHLTICSKTADLNGEGSSS